MTTTTEHATKRARVVEAFAAAIRVETKHGASETSCWTTDIAFKLARTELGWDWEEDIGYTTYTAKATALESLAAGLTFALAHAMGMEVSHGF